jgi:hypothetical protein
MYVSIYIARLQCKLRAPKIYSLESMSQFSLQRRFGFLIDTIVVLHCREAPRWDRLEGNGVMSVTA